MLHVTDNKNEDIVQVLNLKKYFPIHKGSVYAVDDVSFSLRKGETLGLAGESGCGKSTVGRVILNLIKATDGDIIYKGQSIRNLNHAQLQSLRKEMGIVFQNPYSSLNPRMNVLNLVGEPLKIHLKLNRNELRDRVLKLLEQVGMLPENLNRYPHQFSGGQRQRIAIARSLALNPQFIVFDEPTSALDVSVQAQVINLVGALQKEKNLTYLFISHDLTIVEHIADRIIIMYLGKIMEIGPSEEVFNNPRHPYTKGLLSAIPVPDPFVKKEKIILEGDVPSSINPPPGCRFNTRCPEVRDECMEKEPELRSVGDQLVACHYI